jgi:hypothetical protein
MIASASGELRAPHYPRHARCYLPGSVATRDRNARGRAPVGLHAASSKDKEF